MKTLLVFVVLSVLLIQKVRCYQPPVIVGGEFPVELDEETKNRLIGYSLDAFHKLSVSPNKYKVFRFVGSTKQVVSGTNYRLKLELGETVCSKESADTTYCPFKDPQGLNTTKCKVLLYNDFSDNIKVTKVLYCKPEFDD